MNWRLILQLSLFGLIMGIATVFVIPSKIEPFFWLAVFIVSAYLIATRCASQFFLHGVLVGLANSVWVTASHALLFGTYIANHPREVEMMQRMPLRDTPRLMMVVTGPVVGLISGIILGVLALIASKLVKPRVTPTVGVP
ncbi:MAG: hypothetical protein ACR2OG_11730 [Gemmatimonadaceae bacterium]